MIEIKHTCGHIQPVFYDEKISEDSPALKKLGKTKEEFIKQQVDWLSSFPCPPCYSNAHDKLKKSLENIPIVGGLVGVA